MSIEEKYDEVRQLISIGKEKGYLLYDEVNELLPSDITSSEDLDDLFSTFGSAGIEVVDSEQKYREDKLLDRPEGSEELELDLTPGALDKTNDPVRMYLREMGTVPLLTREGEVEIAKRIERGKLSVIKSISRTPSVARTIIAMGDQLRASERTIRELVIFNDEEITDERVEERAREVLKQIEAVRRAFAEWTKRNEKLDTILEEGQRRSTAGSSWKTLRGTRRAVAADPPHRVHRDREAPAGGADQGRASRRSQRVQREVDAIERQLTAEGPARAEAQGRGPQGARPSGSATSRAGARS